MKQVLRSTTLPIWGCHLLRSLLLIGVLMSAKAASANTRYVDSTAGNNTNAGTSWALAYKTLAYAVNQAHSVATIDTILVAKGTYYPEYIAGTGTTNKNKAFTFTRDSLVVIGGYATGGGSRNRNLYPTILSGAADSNYHVLLITGTNIDSTLKFFSLDITGGRTASASSITVNGGVLILSDRGGGIYLNDGSPVFSDVKVFSNYAYLYGAGIFTRGGCPTFLNSLITGNTAMSGGGGFYIQSGCIKISRCSIISNKANADGGGLFNPGGVVTIKQTLIQGNTGYYGGGLSFSSGAGSGSTLTDVIISGNVGQNGGGLQTYISLAITNSTITGNVGGVNDGGQFQANTAMASPVLKNCIIWGSGSNSVKVLNSASPVYTNCIIDGSGGSTAWNTTYGTNGSNNRDTDPAFVNYIAATSGNPTLSGDFRLTSCSPAINRGDNSFYTSTDLRDAALRPRIMGDTIDIGAYESARPTGRKIYVDSASSTNGNGSSWATATISLADAIKAAHENCTTIDSIFVAKGTYYPEYNAGTTTGIREKAFTIRRDSLVILGGYPTGGGIRNAAANPTVMSGARDTNYHVLLTMGSNIDTTLKLDGFTIRNGKANGGGGRTSVNGFDWLFYNRGGGWYNGWGSPMLSNMIITGNASDDYGGGVLVEGNPVVRNLLITNNTSNRGGGWAQITGSAKVDSATFSNNNAVADGGGFYNSDGASTITNSTFNNNTANWGGGFYNNGNTPTIANCMVRNNASTADGGGFFNANGGAIVTNSTIAGNAGSRGGGWCNLSGNPTVSNLLMTGNVATNTGGGWLNDGGNPVIANTTITSNFANTGRDLVTQNGTMTLRNTIIWSSANSISSPQNSSGFQNCIVAGSGAVWNTAFGVNNGGNLDINPLFVNAVAASAGNPVTTGDYRLQPCSPAINKGNNTLASGINKDINGRPRIIGDTVDIGAYEMIRPTGRKIYVDSAIATEGNGGSWATAIRSLAEAVKVAQEGCVPVDSIFIAKGTYYPEYLAGNGTTNRHKSFTFTRNTLAVMGGYASGGGVRDRNLYPTILSGAVDQNFHVMLIVGNSIDSSLKFDGISITGGNASSSSDILVNGISVENSYGGGIYVRSGSPSFSNMSVLSNAGFFGGGIASNGCPTLQNCDIVNNTAQFYGGGMYSNGGCMKVNRCSVSSNRATGSGNGGGWYNSGADIMVANTMISGNLSHSSGGGLYHSFGSLLKMNNVVVTGNAANSSGGGLTIAAPCEIINTTIGGNAGGQIRNENNAAPVLKNCIVWGSGGGSMSVASGTPVYSNCIIDGAGTTTWNTAYGTNGGNNSSADPLFVNYVAATAWNPVTNGDFRLSTCSPAINRGSNSSYTSTNLTDIAARPRIMGDTIDIGAYETARPTRNKIYVDSAAVTNGNGDSWATATRSLADAIQVAHETCTAIDTILVAKGTYYPGYIAGNGTTNRDRSFTFTRDGLVIMGGYASGGSSRNQNLYPTILSGAVDQNYHVVLVAGNNIDSSLKLNGVAITGGLANGGGSSIAVNGSTVAQNRGAGIYLASGSPVFSEVRVSSNISNSMGGGIFSDGCPQLLDCNITGNTSAHHGGGIFSTGGCITVKRSVVADNAGNDDGGGWYNIAATVTVDNTIINGNKSNFGGGLYHESGNCAMTNVVVSGNIGRVYGSGLALLSSASLTNVTIAGNQDNQLRIMNTSAVLKNCIVWGSGTNSILAAGGGDYTNCILDGSGGSAAWNLAYGTDGGNNKDVNPLFMNFVAATSGNPTVNGDYRLSTCSPAINRGKNSFYNSTNLTDIAGNPRIMGDTIDAGAFETAKPTGHKIYVDISAATNGNGDSWAAATRSLADAVKLVHESCTSIDTILVAQGTYYPEYMAGSGTTNHYKSFTFTRDSLVIIGGYASGGGIRNRSLYPTILSGARDQSYHVVLIAGSNIDSSLKFHGIDITGGRADLAAPIALNGNTISCENGGGIHVYSGSPVFSEINVSSNFASIGGGGVYSAACPTFFSSTITDNFSGNSGGGVYSGAGCITLNQCTVASNYAASSGGGLYISSAAFTIKQSLIRGNNATLGGGGYFTSVDPASAMTNVAVTGNTVSYNAGGLYITSPVSLTNVTIAGNSASTYGAQLYTTSSPVLKNAIVWGSTANSIYSTGNPVYTNCILRGPGNSQAWNSAYGTDGGNNKDVDPVFVSPASASLGSPTTDGDFRLSTCSPGINRGNNSFYNSTDLTDIAGRPRIMGDTVDIGAYETAKPTGHKLYVDSASVTNSNGDSWATATRSLAEAVKLAHESCTAIDTIFVAKGTYYPEYIAGNGTTNRHKSFTFTRDSLVVIGGYASGGGVRDRNLYPTILSGTLTQNYHVVVISGNIDTSLKLNSLDITGGIADNANYSTLNVGGPLLWNNCGGGIYITSGSPLFADIKVTSNSAYNGAGIYSEGCPTMLNSSITSNNGSAIRTSSGCMTVNNCIISANIAGGLGAAWYNPGAVITVTNTIITGNESYGGDAFEHSTSRNGSSLTNVLITDNNRVSGATGGSGGMYIGGPLSLTNVNIANNGFGVIMPQLSISGSPVFRNCIVGGVNGNLTIQVTGSPTYSNCIITGSGGSGAAWNTAYGVDGGNNQDVDPMFVNSGAGDYRLQFCSPAINAGNNTAVGAAIIDLMGNPRIIGTTVDIGAYEKQSTVTPGNFGSNVALSNAGGNAGPLLGTSCEDAGWTYYATANNPDSLSFAIQWGVANAAAKATAQLQLTLDTNNTLAVAGNTATATMKRYWNVNLNGSTLAAPVSVRFFYNPADTIAMRNALTVQSGGIIRSLRWFKTNSVAFDPSMVSAADVNGGAVTVLTPAYGTANNVAYAEFNNITSFSGGTAAISASAAPLPVQLIDFTARKIKQGQVLLNWEVADEQLQGYVVMRSRNGGHFQSIGTIKAAGKHNYTFTDLIDESGFANSTIYYRLALDEYSGATGYSKVVRINIGDVRNPIMVSPNPVQHAFTVSQIESTLIGEPVIITDATGKLIAQPVLEEGLKVDVSQWGAGVYFLRLPGRQVVKIIKL